MLGLARRGGVAWAAVCRRPLGGGPAAAAACGPGANGRQAVDPDRAALSGALFVLKVGISWEMRPPEMECGSKMSCWRGRADGKAERQSHSMGSGRRRAGRCWSVCTRQCSSTGAARCSTAPPCRKGGGAPIGPNPPGRSKPGTKAVPRPPAGRAHRRRPLAQHQMAASSRPSPPPGAPTASAPLAATTRTDRERSGYPPQRAARPSTKSSRQAP